MDIKIKKKQIRSLNLNFVQKLKAGSHNNIIKNTIMNIIVTTSFKFLNKI